MYKPIVIENNEISVQVVPEVGGRIQALHSKKSCYDWVWKEKETDKINIIQPYSEYDSQWSGSWEELYPNDAIEYFNSNEAPDHGELWNSVWEVREKSEKKLLLSTSGYFSQTIVEKTYELKENQLEVKYRLTNIPYSNFLFKLHLAMPISNTSIDFSYEKCRKVDTNFGNIVRNPKDNLEVELFLNNIKTGEGTNDFLYFDGVGSDIKITEHSSSSNLTLSYDKETMPHFWIFQTRGGWMGKNVVVLEPCTNGIKNLSKAIENNLAISTEDGTFTTWYRVNVE